MAVTTKQQLFLHAGDSAAMCRGNGFCTEYGSPRMSLKWIGFHNMYLALAGDHPRHGWERSALVAWWFKQPGFQLVDCPIMSHQPSEIDRVVPAPRYRRNSAQTTAQPTPNRRWRIDRRIYPGHGESTIEIAGFAYEKTLILNAR